MKKILSWVLAVALSFLALPVNADTIILTGTVNPTSTGATTPIPISQQTACNFTTSGSFTGLSATVQITPDNSTWVTSGYSSPITAAGTVAGVLTTASVLTPLAFRFNVTALTSGNPTIVYACGPASSSATVGSVTQGTTPWVVGQATGTNLHTVCDSGCAAPVATAPPGQTGYPAPNGGATNSNGECTYSTVAITATSGNVYPCQMDSSGNIKVLTTPSGTQTVSGTVTATQGTGTNLHTVTDSGSTTAVTQATASNLNATVVQGTAANLNATVVQPTAANLNATVTGTTNCGNCGMPFTGGAAGVATAAGQTVGVAAYNGSTMDSLKDTSGALNVHSDGSFGVPSAVNAMLCTGTVGSTNMTCVNEVAGATNTVCVNNAGDSCTVASATVFYGWHDASGANPTAGFACYDSTNSTLSGFKLLMASSTTSVVQAGAIWLAPSAGINLTTGKLTCAVSGSAGNNLGSTGFIVYYK